MTDTVGSSDAGEPELSIEVPELDESDPVLRSLLARLSDHPEWARWLVPDDLVRRFVTAVVNVADGGSPASHLDFLEPSDSFRVRQAGERLVIHPASYARYDRLVDTFESLDTETAARLYGLLHPLFEQAHRELGLPDRDFDDSFARALGNLLAVDVPQAEIEVVPDRAVYEFQRPELRALTSAEKHLVRLGPSNARRVQAKIRELAAALDIVPVPAEAREQG